MFRRVRSILVVCSLALFVAAAVLWLRDATRYQGVRWNRERPLPGDGKRVESHEFAVYSTSGRLGVNWHWWERVPFPLLRTAGKPPPSPPPDGWRRYVTREDLKEPWPWDLVPRQTIWTAWTGDQWSWMGFQSSHSKTERAGPFPSASRGREYAVPCWFVMLVTAVAPGRRVLRWFRRRRAARRGLCAGCGFDLRATPDRCPECGEIP